MSAEVGDKAPNFDLPSDSWENRVSLEDYTKRGPVVLFFYPGDWSSVCTDQMDVVEDHLPDFAQRGANVLAVSVDSPWSHAAFAHARELTIPLLSDFGREISKSYGVLRKEGFTDRAFFVIDGEGKVLARHVEATPSQSPDVEVVLDELDRVL